MFQYSWSATLVYGGYQNGVAMSFGGPKVAFYGAVVSSVWNGADTNLDDMGFEAQISLMPSEKITAKIAYLWEDMGAYKQSLANGWVSFKQGKLLLAGEYNYLKDWGGKGNDGYGWILMGNMGLSDKAAVTLRYSGLDTDLGGKTTEVTVSPSYLIADNWGILAEFRRDIDAKKTSFAVETTFKF
jgi:hypothetical protein